MDVHSKISVLLVDDHRMLREGLRLLIEADSNFSVVGGASTGVEARELAEAVCPNVVVMDIHLPDMDGIEVARRIIESCPRTKVVVLSSDPSTHLIDKALRIGAHGYVFKEEASEELLRALKSVIEGKFYLCPDANTAVLRDYEFRGSSGRSNRIGLAKLSNQEMEVLRHIASGLRTKEAADRMNLGVKTVETYRRRIMVKLKLGSVADMTRYAIREGIISA